MGGGEGGKLFRVACWCHFQTNGRCNMCCPNSTSVLPKCVARIVAQLVAQIVAQTVAQIVARILAQIVAEKPDVLPKNVHSWLPKRCCPNRKWVFRMRKTIVLAFIRRTSSTSFFCLANTIWATLFKAKKQSSSPEYVHTRVAFHSKGQSMCASLDHLSRPFAQAPTICFSSDRPFCPDHLRKSQRCLPKLRDRVQPRPQKPNEKTKTSQKREDKTSLKRCKK